MSQLLYYGIVFRRRAAGPMILGFAFVIALLVPHTAQGEDNTTRLRVVAYNVACGQWATPEQVATSFKLLKPDIVFLNEVPKANVGEDVKDWSHQVAEKLGLNHVYVGDSSSANHKAPEWGDLTGHYGGKFKSVLSRTPLTDGRDYMLKGRGWSPASVVRVETRIGGRKFALYSLHLPGTGNWRHSKHRRLADIIAAEDASFDVIVGGDFNERTDSVIMRTLLSKCNLKNAVTSPSIDHILYSAATPVNVLDVKKNWGPKKKTKENRETEGHLSDHPWVWCEIEILTNTSSE